MKYLWISILFAAHAGATTVDSYLLNRDGIAKLEKKNYYPAFKDFAKAIEDDPMNPGLHLNLALALEMNEEYEKAEQAYRSALSLIPEGSTLRFEALFNLGGVQAKQKKIPDALTSYQSALEIDPESKDVKTAIELLWQQGEGDGEGGDGEPKENDKEGKGDQKQDQGQQPKKEQKKQPKPFDSQNLTPQDVKKILDEIKNQEQSIRAQEYEKGAKEAPRGKDW